MLTDVADVFLNTDEHAATYTLTAYNGGATSSVTGVWDVMESTRDDTKGRRTVHSAKFETASSTAIRIDDRISVNSETWTCHATGPANVGMKCWLFQRIEVHNQGATPGTNFK
jgi:hypothetical protein